MENSISFFLPYLHSICTIRLVAPRPADSTQNKRADMWFRFSATTAPHTAKHSQIITAQLHRRHTRTRAGYSIFFYNVFFCLQFNYQNLTYFKKLTI